MTRREQIAWAAGFFDGEGCISIVRQKAPTSRRGYYYALRISAGQKDKRPLEILLALFGGRVTTHNGQSQWIASAGPGVKALEAMLPYLVVKREQAEVAIKFQSRRGERERSHAGKWASSTDGEVKLDHEDFKCLQSMKKIYY